MSPEWRVAHRRVVQGEYVAERGGGGLPSKRYRRFVGRAALACEWLA